MGRRKEPGTRIDVHVQISERDATILYGLAKAKRRSLRSIIEEALNCLQEKELESGQHARKPWLRMHERKRSERAGGS